jgi:hypothetical protein
MKKLLVVALLALLVGWVLRAQISPTVVSYLAVASTALASGCPAPSVGYTIYCQGSDKFQISANGAPYTVVWPAGSAPITTGVTSITVNGGTPQTGPVVLTIPTKAVSSTTTTIQ